MRVEWGRLESAVKICLGTSLASLAMLAVMVNAAFYSALADYWPAPRLLSPAVFFAAMVMAASLVLGLVLHGMVVVNRRRWATPGKKASHPQTEVRRAA